MQAVIRLYCVIIMGCLTTGTGTVNVSTTQKVPAECNETVTLYCNITSQPGDFNDAKMQWVKSDSTLCTNNEANQSFKHISCNYTEKQTLALTIQRVNETDNGTYICKLMTDINHTSSNTTLEVLDCNGEINKTLQRQISMSQPNKASASGSQSMWLLFLLTPLLFSG